MSIEFIAAPLIAVGLSPSGWKSDSLTSALFVSGFFAAALWFWHLPWVYEWTFRSDVAYWLMHMTLLLTAVFLWRLLLNERHPAASFLASSLTAGQMALLGAVYTFANHPLFDVHLVTTQSWGFSTLEDQQLGGLLMWIPPGIILAGVALTSIKVMLTSLNPTTIPRPGKAL